jgi:hypothetical protein
MIKNIKNSFITIFFGISAFLSLSQAMEKEKVTPDSSQNSTTVDVSNLPMSDVLIVLYNNATGTSVSTAAQIYLQTVHLNLSRNDASKHIGKSVDYLNGRIMALRLDQKPENLSCKGYNDNHGPNRAQGAVQKLRELLKTNSNPTEDELRFSCYFSVWEQVIQNACTFHDKHKDTMPTQELISTTMEMRSSLKGDADCVGTQLAAATDEESLRATYDFATSLSNCGNRGNGSQNRFQTFGDMMGMNPDGAPQQPKGEAPQHPVPMQAPAAKAKAREKNKDTWAQGIFASPPKTPPKDSKK